MDQKKPMLGDVAYHDYLTLLCAIDAEWTRAPCSGENPNELAPFAGVFRQFTSRCWQYGRGVAAAHGEWLRANGAVGRPAGALDPYLYNPLCYCPAGHPDALCVALLDDFDPIHHLSAWVTTTIENVSLGFSPKLESLGLSANGSLCELHQLFGNDPVLPEAEMGGGEMYGPASHSVQRVRPLLVFTKYKMDGLGCLGQGLLFQQALFRAMGKRIERITAELHRRAEQKTGAAGALMSSEDVSSLRCALLDLQGAEEIGTLIFCRNFSAAMAVVAGLRSVTWSDLFAADKRLPYRVSDLLLSHPNQLHHRVLELNSRERSPDTLKPMHVFRWSDSMLSVSWPTFAADGRRENCNGFLEMTSEFHICPGHRLGGERDFKTVVEAEEDELPTSVPQGSCRRFLVGTADAAVSLRTVGRQVVARDAIESGGATGISLVGLRPALATVREHIRRFSVAPRNSGARDVTDIVASLVIPVPKVPLGPEDQAEDLLCGDPRSTHVAPLTALLPETRSRLCYFSERPDEAQRRIDCCRNDGPGSRQRAGRLDVNRLRHAMRLYGIPVSLRRSIEFLYQDFGSLLADPFLFDTVLDLYDAFATFHAILSEHLPARPELSPGGSSWRARPLLDEARIEQLSLVVDAIHNALAHRLFGAYPDTPLRDMAIDFRGGLNQILVAADAPQKCGIGFVRKFVQASSPPCPCCADTRRDTVAALTKIGFVPGAGIVTLRLGTERDALLGFLELDVPHVLHAADFTDLLHECLHLAFRSACDEGGMLAQISCESENMRERLNEIFVLVLGNLLTSGTDTETFLRHQLANYSKRAASVGTVSEGEEKGEKGLIDDMARCADVFLRLFVATDIIKAACLDPAFTGSLPCEWPADQLPTFDTSLPAVRERFKSMIRHFGPYFSDYEYFQEGNHRFNFEPYCMAQIRDLYPEILRCLPELWQTALCYYRRFATDAYPERNRPEMMEDIQETIEAAFAQGRPIIRALQHERFRRAAERPGVDSLLLVGGMLHAYLARISEAEGKRLHLYRQPRTGDVDFSVGTNWHDFLIDRGAAAMFCPVPKARRERLQRQIVVLKTFWDISSALRARRLWEILDDNWPLPVRSGV